MRIFFALSLEPKARIAVSRLIQHKNDPNISWLKYANLHVTLCFLGNTHPEQIPQLINTVKNTTEFMTCFTIEFISMQTFPSPEKPKVIALIPRDNQQLIDLAYAVQNGAKACNFSLEARKFRPHLSLGRISRKAPISISAQELTPPIACYFNKIVLFQSLGNANYLALDEIELH